MTDIVILDFGSQTTHLIGRRIGEFGQNFKILPGNCALSEITSLDPKALIFSGGPASVYGKTALLPDPEIYNLKLPILGICYGSEVIAQQLGGKVQKGTKGEYGLAKLRVQGPPFSLFAELPENLDVWMSHFDIVGKLPKGFVATSSTDKIKYSSFENKSKGIYAVFFHPEVVHTQLGTRILENFLVNICKFLIPSHRKSLLERKFAGEFIERKVREIKKIIRNDKAICALSGGVDSTVAALLTFKAIGQNLTCIYVDTGLMRQDETEQVKKTFSQFKIPLVIVRAEVKFLKAMKNVIDPEKKRIIIGRIFIEVFEEEVKKLKNIEYLVQGTIYPDVIESKGTKHSHKIKSHHNVAGLPKNMTLKLIEPLRELYKDQVREIARELGLAKEIIWRQVFPGPGLAVRIIGEVTKEKLELLRKADKIVNEEIRKANLWHDLWMSFAILTGIKTTGVVGDERMYGETIAIRAITSRDTMTADWARLPYDLLAKISNRITSEVKDVCRVVYDITTKPPGTMEWE